MQEQENPPNSNAAPGQDPRFEPARARAGEPIPEVSAGDPVRDLNAELDAAHAKAEEHYQSFLRAVAETDNVRRRAQEDVAKARKFGIESFAEGLVPVMDSLEAALADQTQDTAKLREGVELTLKQLQNAFEKNRLVAINPIGEKFDPHLHQAVSAVPAPDGVAPNSVVAVLQKGWSLADRVLRPALVTVAQGS